MGSGTTINVLYFAQVAEIIGKRHETLNLPRPIIAKIWLRQLSQLYPNINQLKQLKIAINQEHANLAQIINPGDEVAVFEPVTGG